MIHAGLNDKKYLYAYILKICILIPINIKPANQNTDPCIQSVNNVLSKPYWVASYSHVKVSGIT